MRYVIGRIQRLIIVLVIVTFATFLLVNVLPGDVAYQLGGMEASEEQIERIRQTLGLDQPVLVRYFGWMADLLRGDWGHSLLTGESVWEMIAQRFPISLQLMLMAQVMALALAIPAGLATAWRAGGWLDRLVTSIGFATVSMPTFLIAILLIYLFSLHLGWLPAIGASRSGDPMSYLTHLILPALAVGLRNGAGVARMTRAYVLEVMYQDFVRTARAKGVPPLRLALRHLLPNALLPVTTVAGVHIGGILGGAVVVETVFNWPGLGRLGFDAILQRDFNLLLGIILISSFMVIVVNLLVDLFQAWLDPRIEGR